MNSICVSSVRAVTQSHTVYHYITPITHHCHANILTSAGHKNNIAQAKADKHPSSTSHFSPFNCSLSVVLLKGIILKIHMLCFVLINSILFNLLCVWTVYCCSYSKVYCWSYSTLCIVGLTLHCVLLVLLYTVYCWSYSTLCIVVLTLNCIVGLTLNCVLLVLL